MPSRPSHTGVEQARGASRTGRFEENRMAFDAIETAKRGASRRLIGKAVHRNRSASTEGLLERLFTLAFSGLVYPQIWEDPAVDMAAMAIEPHHHIVAIASG